MSSPAASLANTAPFTPAPLSRWHWLLPAAALGFGTVLIWALDLDRRVAALYHDPAGPPAWPVGYRQPWAFLYTWGVMPAMAVAVTGIALLTLGTARRLPWQRWAGVLLILSLLSGPFLLTNGVFHELWGRPRPRQIVEFGGDRAFRPVLLPTFRRDEQGFPTGHAAGGFSVLVLYLALRPRSRVLAGAALAAGLALGSVTAWARVTQGGHFLSDGLWSAGVIWFSAWAVHEGMTRWGFPGTSTAPPSRLRRYGAWAMGAAAAAALLAGYTAYLPIQERSDWRMDVPAGVHGVLAVIATPGKIRVQEAPGATQVRVFTTLSGRGWPWATLWERHAGPVTVGNELRLHYTAQGRGMRRGGNVSVVVVAPPGLEVTVQQQDFRPLQREPRPAQQE
jgi:membrane-associated PAP2 superfamily phosphatase